MFAASRGEFLLVVFIFALVWGAGVLPRFGERLGLRMAARVRERDGLRGDAGHGRDGG
jgi:Sec-independent protein translocase protein TatA